MLMCEYNSVYYLHCTESKFGMYTAHMAKSNSVIVNQLALQIMFRQYFSNKLHRTSLTFQEISLLNVFQSVS